MDDTTFSASDFSSAEASLSSDPAPASDPASAESSAPVDAAAPTGEATTQPAATTTDSPSTEPKPAGPIPFDVHKTALENARQKAVAEWEQQYGWAKQVNQQELASVMQMAQRASADPIGYLQDFIKELQVHPTYGQQLKSLAARALSQRGQTGAVDQEPQPDLPIQLEDGRVVHLYSAEQQAKREAWLQTRWQSDVDQKLHPLLQTQQQLEQQREAAQRQFHDNQFVSRVFDDLKTRPGVSDDSMKAMATALSQDRQFMSAKNYEQAELAVERVYRTVVIPALQTTERRAVLTDIRHQANASTVNPASSTTRAAKSYEDMTTAEALQHVASQLGG